MQNDSVTKIAKLKMLFINILFPVILFVYPLYGYNMGADLSDTTYSLANYMFFGELSGSWKYATFLSNLTGAGLMKLAGGKMAVMNIITAMIISCIALLVYKFLKDRYNPVAVFLAEIIAVCMAWCPSVILYNYLTYLLLTIAAIILYKAVINDSGKLYIISGAVLGVNVFVRISNAIEVLLIVAVWIAIAMANKRSDEKRKYVKPTLLCMAGFVIGLGISVLIIVIAGGTGGITETFSWAFGLFSSGDSAGGYSLSEMLLVILQNYFGNVKMLVISLVAVSLGICGFGVVKDRFVIAKRIGYVICLGILFYYFYRNGVFTTNYHNNGAIFGICVLAIFMQYIINIFVIVKKGSTYENKVLSLLAVIILFITPLGSNNHLFTIINNMFFTLPITVGIGFELYKEYSKDEKKKELIFAPASFAVVLMGVLLVQGVLFRLTYVFVDGEDGLPLDTPVVMSDTMDGMKTEKSNADNINGLCMELNDYSERQLLLYGNIPGVSYLMEMQVAISTSWPDLDSYSEKDFNEELLELAKLDEKPVIVVERDTYNRLWNSNILKDNYMLKYIVDADYNVTFMNDGFAVLDCE